MTDAQTDASTIAKLRETLHVVARKNPISRSFKVKRFTVVGKPMRLHDNRLTYCNSKRSKT